MHACSCRSTTTPVRCLDPVGMIAFDLLAHRFAPEATFVAAFLPKPADRCHRLPLAHRNAQPGSCPGCARRPDWAGPGHHERFQSP